VKRIRLAICWPAIIAIPDFYVVPENGYRHRPEFQYNSSHLVEDEAEATPA
jgi:hypothetical protein